MSGELTPDAVLSRLATQWLGRDYRFADEVDSTNSRVADLAREGAPHGLVMVAEAQTNGRGRLQREWFSPAGQNLYFSVLLRPGWQLHTPPPLSLAAGVGLAEAVADLVPRRVELKWPNDLLLDDRKLAGILVEMAAARGAVDYVVLGIGLNVNQADFPGPLATTAVSLRTAGGQPLDRLQVLLRVLERLEHWIDRLHHQGAADVVAAWQRHAAWIGMPVRVNTGRRDLRGIVLGVDANGALRLRDEQGVEQTVLSGDTFRLDDRDEP